MLVLHPNMVICKAGALTMLVVVKVCRGMSVSVAGGIFVLVGKNVGVIVAVGITGVADAFVAPMTTGVGLKIDGVRVGRTNGVGGLYGKG
jgi:hypothetical protein